MAAVLKTAVGASPPRVRIPFSPPKLSTKSPEMSQGVTIRGFFCPFHCYIKSWKVVADTTGWVEMGKNKSRKKMDKEAEESHRSMDIGGLHRKKGRSNWYYRCTINGKTKDISTGTDDIDEAEKIARAKFLPMTQGHSGRSAGRLCCCGKENSNAKRETFS